MLSCHMSYFFLRVYKLDHFKFNHLLTIFYSHHLICFRHSNVMNEISFEFSEIRLHKQTNNNFFFLRIMIHPNGLCYYPRYMYLLCSESKCMSLLREIDSNLLLC